MQALKSNTEYTEYSFSHGLYETNKDDCTVLIFDEPVDKFQYIMHSNDVTGYCLFVNSNDETKTVGCTELRYVKIRIPTKYKRVPFCPDIPNVGVYYNYSKDYEAKVVEYRIFISGEIAVIFENGAKLFTYAKYLTMDILDE